MDDIFGDGFFSFISIECRLKFQLLPALDMRAVSEEIHTLHFHLKAIVVLVSEVKYLMIFLPFNMKPAIPVSANQAQIKEINSAYLLKQNQQ
jgi:hypothetical protein